MISPLDGIGVGGPIDPKLKEKTLLRAAELVERGWCRNHMGKAGEERLNLSGLERAEQVCLVGAISLALHEITGLPILLPEGARYSATHPKAVEVGPMRYMDPRFSDARRQVMNAVGAALPLSCKSLSLWNDNTAKDADEVAAKLREAARA